MTNITPGRIAIAVGGLLSIIMIFVFALTMSTTVGASDIVIHQDAFSGDLTVWDKPGWHWKGLGDTTTYKRMGFLAFKKGSKTDGPIKVRFNDQGTADISGSLNFKLPSDPAKMLMLHANYRNQEGIEDQLIRPVVTSAVNNSGPLMSSKDSSGKKRGALIRLIEEQISKGIFKTKPIKLQVDDFASPPVVTMKEIREPKVDENGEVIKNEAGEVEYTTRVNRVETPAQKTVESIEPVFENGKVLLEAVSAVATNQITISNVVVEDIEYEEKVQRQIDNQRDQTMAIQTKIAEAQKAKQDAITSKQKGMARVAEAKADEEVKKIRAVTVAEMRRSVAEENLKTAKLESQDRLVRARAEADSAKLLIAADGALKMKIDAWLKSQEIWAVNIGKNPQVPQIMMGGGTSSSSTALMDLLGASAAKQLGVNLSMK